MGASGLFVVLSLLLNHKSLAVLRVRSLKGRMLSPSELSMCWEVSSKNKIEKM